jgi:hypothetical protein
MLVTAVMLDVLNRRGRGSLPEEPRWDGCASRAAPGYRHDGHRREDGRDGGERRPIGCVMPEK